MQYALKKVALFGKTANAIIIIKICSGGIDTC